MSVYVLCVYVCVLCAYRMLCVCVLCVYLCVLSVRGTDTPKTLLLTPNVNIVTYENSVSMPVYVCICVLCVCMCVLSVRGLDTPKTLLLTLSRMRTDCV